MPNCQVLSKSFYCSRGDFSFPTYELSGVKCIVVFQDPGYGKTQLHRFLPVLFFHDPSCQKQTRTPPFAKLTSLMQVSFTAAAQIPRSTWNIEGKHAQLHCIIIKAGVLEYLLVLALPETDGTDPRNPCRGREKVVVRSEGFQTLIHFVSIWWTDRHISDCVKHRSFWRLKPSFSSDHQTWYVLISCRTSLGYAMSPASSKSPPQKLHFQALLRYLWGAGLCM